MEESHVLLHIPDPDPPEPDPNQFGIMNLDLTTIECVQSDGQDATADLEETNAESTEYYIQQPDGTRVKILSFLASDDIDGVSSLPLLPDALQETADHASTSNNGVNGGKIIPTYVNSSHQVSAIQSADGDIYYIESYAVDNVPGSGDGPVTVVAKLVNGTPVASDSFLPPKTSEKPHGRSEATVAVVGSDLGVEDRMRVLETMLPKRAHARRGHHTLPRICKRTNVLQPGAAGSVLQQKYKIEFSKSETPGYETETGTEEEMQTCEEQGAMYNCDMCNASYPRAHQFYGHSRTHSNERTLKCSICADVFSAHGALYKHERRCHTSVRRHECATCGASFERASQLGYHRRRVHLEEKSHLCQICQRSFFKRSDLKSHVNIHLGLNSKVCDTCGKSFNHISNLNRHLRTHTGVKPYPCSQCGRRFNQPGALAQHKMTHDPRRPVTCIVCDKSFRNRVRLRRHLLLDHKDDDRALQLENEPKPTTQSRNFYCQVCGAVFKYATLLKNHESMHAKDDMFHCSGCNQDLSSVKNLLSHECRSAKQRARAEQAALDQQLENLLEGLQLRRNAPDDVNDIVMYVTHDAQNQPTQVHLKPSHKSLKLIDQNATPNILEPEDEVENLAAESEQLLQFAKDAITPLENNTKTLPTLELDDIIPSESEEEMLCSPSPIPMPADEPDMDGREVMSLELESGEMVLVEVMDEEEVLLLHGEIKNGKITTIEAALPVDEEPDRRSPEPVDGLLEPNEVPPSSEDEEEYQQPLEQPAEKTVDIVISVTNEPPFGPLPKKKTVKIFQCETCQKEFTKSNNYKQHLGTHYADKKLFQCKCCDQSFAWKSTLNKHMMKCHQTEPRQKYSCELCDREYWLQSQVQDHIKRDHQKQRSHVCAVCQKQFFKKHDLMTHERVHTGERPYICAVCGKGFYHSSHMIRHEQMHAGSKNYVCTDCGQRFTQASSLKSHSTLQGRCSKVAAKRQAAKSRDDAIDESIEDDDARDVLGL